MKRNIFSAIIVAALLLTSCSEIDNPPQPNTGKGIGFEIDLSQDWKAEKASTRKKMRRQPIHAVPMQMSDGGQLWLKAVTTNGIKRGTENITTAVADDTRGTPITSLTQMSDFSSFCYKSADNAEFYYNMSSTSEGTLAQKQMWPWDQSLKFFAVHPYDSNNENFGGSPETGLTYNFTVNPTVTKQVDLMYATTGDLDYNLEEKAPLHFNHALTAVNFVMGDVRFYGQLKEIKLKNVYTSGTLTLPTEPTTSTGETPSVTWSNLGARDVIVNDHDFDITTGSGHVGQTITTGNNVFMMIPQELDDVVVELTFDVSGEIITVSGNLSGSAPWEPGTTRTYIINSTKDISEYFFAVDAAPEVAFNAESMNIGVKSFFLNPDGSATEVEWEEVSRTYSGGNGSTGWLGFPTSGTGSETVTTPIDDSFIDVPAVRDNTLRNAESRGTAADPWDLSTHDFNGNTTAMNTANCYIISAPGVYKLPLVYGNAIQNGNTAEKSYTLTNTTFTSPSFDPTRIIDVMERFLDYHGDEIRDPWLKNNEDALNSPTVGYVPETAFLVWSDISENILTNPHIDDNKEYLIFEVKAENLTEHGNAVVAVKDGFQNYVMWSWHLWFTTPDALGTTTITRITPSTGHPNQFHFANENLGSKYEKWLVSNYKEERQVIITLQQKEAREGEEKKTATFTIKQKPGREMNMSCTYYQGGRKDAFPGFPIGSGKFYPDNNVTATIPSTDGVPYEYSIRNPGKAYIRHYDYTKNPYYDWCNATYTNTWAGNQFSTSYGTASSYDGSYDNFHNPQRHLTPIKTIYDPCPVGFMVPSLCAFTSFTPSNLTLEAKIDNPSPNYRPHVQLPWDNGWNLYTSADETETIYFPAMGQWNGNTIENKGDRSPSRNYGNYWHSQRGSNGDAKNSSYGMIRFSNTSVVIGARYQNVVRFALPIRPMVEETE